MIKFLKNKFSCSPKYKQVKIAAAYIREKKGITGNTAYCEVHIGSLHYLTLVALHYLWSWHEAVAHVI